MISFVITRENEKQIVEHGDGPIEFGRGPMRGGVARVVVSDRFVSRDHLRIEETKRGMAEIENLSRVARVLLDDGSAVEPGGKAERWLPAKIQIGATVIESQIGGTERFDVGALASIPIRQVEPGGIRPLAELGESPTPEELARWFEPLLADLRAAPGSHGFHSQAVAALVERVGLDGGMVLLRRGAAWDVAASSSAAGSPPSLPFSHTILGKLVAHKRTFYQRNVQSADAASLMGVQAVEEM